MHLTLEQVMAMAPDANAGKAAQKLGSARSWKNTGQDVKAVWGECQGSALYQVRVDFADFAYKCNCPSRKLPCKHVLGLLLLACQAPEAIGQAEQPQWVADWLAQRTARAEKKAAKAKAPSKPKDEKAAARRREQRIERIDDGVNQLDLWMEDLVRNGLGNVAYEGFQPWEKQAARLVDAQAPGLAARVREMGAIPGSGSDWPARLLAAMGRLTLLTQAWRRLDQLDPDLASEVRQLVGINVSEEERIALGQCVEDQWASIGQWIDDSDRVRVRRTWLVGTKSQRTALILQFSVAGQPFGQNIVPGTQQKATLRFWPGVEPTRAEFLSTAGSPTPIAKRLPGVESIDNMFDKTAERISRQPWHDRQAFVVYDLIPTVSEEGAWLLIDRDQNAIPLYGDQHWLLLASSGGEPVDVAGEWNGLAFRLLGTMSQGRFTAIQGVAA